MAQTHGEARVKKLQQQKILHCSPKRELRMENHLQERKKLRPAQRGEGQRRLQLLLEGIVVPGGKGLQQELKELQQIRLLRADPVIMLSTNERSNGLLHTYQCG